MAEGFIEMGSGGARKGAGRPKGINTTWSKETQDRFRGLIQTDAIIQRLNSFASGAEGVVMLPHAVTAALGLLRKVLPDTATVEHSGEIATTKVIRAPSVADSAKDWSDNHVPEGHTEH